jgi:hypothetical protein
MDGSWLAGSGLGKLAMLSRRTFLTTIAAAPLARFCKTEPAVMFGITNCNHLHNRRAPEIAAHIAQRMEEAMRRKFPDLAFRHALPQGALG